jgi:hypothetical protein
MKTLHKRFIVLWVSLFVLGIIWGCDSIEKPNNELDYTVESDNNLDINNSINALPISELSESEKQWLILMREEEKLARDVYKTLWEKRWSKIFNNIAQSEQTHTNAVKVLLDRYMITDPVVDDTIWNYTSSEIKKLYDDLVNQWSQSLQDALIVWATIEDLDIKDLNKLIQETDNEDIKMVYENLNNGSYNHLRSFVKNIVNNGGSYSPKYISQTEYDQIISSQ